MGNLLMTYAKAKVGGTWQQLHDCPSSPCRSIAMIMKRDGKKLNALSSTRCDGSFSAGPCIFCRSDIETGTWRRRRSSPSLLWR